ncbi:MAG TPA: tripartite tricarboxylate transporter TctB family protein [Nocardioidaceae bacterium]|nr:tripartite tricarboxylate transporter TctB family protein [Nocardioidaceae bacterium]
MRADLVCGGILIVIAGTFWVQRDTSDRLYAAFPDLLLVVLAVLGVVIIVQGLVRGERGAGEREVNRRMLAIVSVLLVAWALGMGLVGFTISGVVAFVIMALLVREGRPRLREVATDTAAGVVIVVACFLIFTRVLLVPLPVSTLIGM